MGRVALTPVLNPSRTPLFGAGKHANVLVVWPDQDILETVEDEAENFASAHGDTVTVHYASNPQEAEKIVQEKKLDLVITDYMFSRGEFKEGIELTRNIRNQQGSHPFILLVVDTLREEAAKQSGADRVHNGVLNLDTLDEIIGRIFDKLA